jgi:hypothetical protein
VKQLYLDWSGDAGFKFRRGSSRYLTFACVTCATPFEQPLGVLRARYSLGKAFHFRFAKASEFIKPHFFAVVGAMPLRGVVLRVDKTRLPAESHHRRGEALLSELAAETICQMPAVPGEERTLVFDGPRAERALWQALRVACSARLREAGLPPMAQVQARPARAVDGLQVADMLAGAAASEHLADNALLGRLGGKVVLVDYAGEKQKRPG